MKQIFQKVMRFTAPMLLVTIAAGLAFAVEPSMSKAQAKELIGKASTPEDHHRLAQYFTQKADNMEADAVEHEELAQEYTKHPSGVHEMKHQMSGGTAAHCKYFATEAGKPQPRIALSQRRTRTWQKRADPETCV
jgi:chromosome segregation and condensation protein ScpB